MNRFPFDVKSILSIISVWMNVSLITHVKPSGPNPILYTVPSISVLPPDLVFCSIYHLCPAHDLIRRAGDQGFVTHVLASKTMV